jgi:hypothetical protein
LIDALVGPFWMSANATGKIKYLQIVIAGILLLNLPMAYILLENGFSPVSVFIGKLLLFVVVYIYRMLYVKFLLKFTFRELVKNLLLRVLLISFMLGMSILALKMKIFPPVNGFLSFIFQSSFLLFLTSLYIYTIGVNKNERGIVNNYIKNYYKNL